MTEELEQLLKESETETHAECLRRADARGRESSGLLLGVPRRSAAHPMARPAGKCFGVADSESESARTLVARNVSLGAPAWCQPQTDAGVRGTRLRRETREPGVREDGTHVSLKLSPATDKAPALVWELDAGGGRLTGIQKRGDRTVSLIGVRVPDLKRTAPKAWTSPEALFNGKNLDGWEPIGDPANSHRAGRAAGE
jgi:hypothetical protein